jgi:tetratricopeptide (TPR) repeat protein
MRKIKTSHLLVLAIVLSLGTGFLFYNLIDIPFGFLFNLSFFLLVGNLSFGLVILTLMCFRAKRKWLLFVGVLPLLIFIIIASLTLIITIDYRLLYFKGVPPSPSTEEWGEDLSYLETKMREIHPNPFWKSTDEYFTNLINITNKKITTLDNASIFFELIKILALAHDSHTSFLNNFFLCQKHHSFPIVIGGFNDGWFVLKAGRGRNNLIGKKLIKIGNMNIDKIFRLSKEVWGTENEFGALGRFPLVASWAEWLKSQNIINDAVTAKYTFLGADGEFFDCTLSSVNLIPWMYWAFFKKAPSEDPPQIINKRIDAFKYDLIDQNKTIHIRYNEDVKYSNGESIDSFSERLLKSITDNNIERIIIDLRNNIGGDNEFAFPLLNIIKSTELAHQRGKLFTIIGRHTFSAGVTFAELIKNNTEAIFIGETTSHGPLYYSIPKKIELPNSKLIFRISSELTGYTLNQNPKRKISPEIWIKYNYKNILENVDPAIEVIKQANYSYNIPAEIPDKILGAYCGRYFYNPITLLEISKKKNKLYYQLTDFSKYDLNLRGGYLYPNKANANSFQDFRKECQIKFSTTKGTKNKQLIMTLHSNTDTLKMVEETFKLPMELFLEGNYKDGAKLLLEKKEEYLEFDSDIESYLNIIGYELLFSENIKDAIEVFMLNTNLFPNSPNTFDSLAEAYMVNGQKELAIKYYKKCLELDPNQTNAKIMVKKLIN